MTTVAIFDAVDVGDLDPAFSDPSVLGAVGAWPRRVDDATASWRVEVQVRQGLDEQTLDEFARVVAADVEVLVEFGPTLGRWLPRPDAGYQQVYRLVPLAALMDEEG